MMRLALIVSVIGILVLVPACGSSDDASDGPSAKVDQAAPAGDRSTHAVRVAAKPPAKPDELTADAAGENFDYEEYDSTVEELVALLDEYWQLTAEAEGSETYGPPTDVISYDPEDPESPSCGGEPAAPENAFYCSEGDIIAWDEPNLFVPYYQEKGDLAVGIILAHEWAHLIQHRLGLDEQYGFTIESELAADCLAGTWLGAMDEEDLLDGKGPGEGGDIDEALDAIFSIGDPPDTPFEDPEAHGLPEERIEALETGYTNGFDGCDQDYAPGFASEAGSDVEPRNVQGGDNIGAG